MTKRFTWFGLTDAYYWMDFTGTQLFRYSDEFIEFHKINKALPYVDYPFARIFQDFTGIVQTVLRPIPDEIFENIRMFADFTAYLNTLSDWIEREWNESEEQYDGIYAPARQWIDDRRLDSGYLIGAPNIYIFRNRDKILVRWIADYHTDEGIPMWAAAEGEYVMDLEDFIHSVQQSFRSFALAMDAQVNHVLDHPLENVYIDKIILLKNHEAFLQEVDSYDKILSFVSEHEEWDEIRTSIQIIQAGTS